MWHPPSSVVDQRLLLWLPCKTHIVTSVHRSYWNESSTFEARSQARPANLLRLCGVLLSACVDSGGETTQCVSRHPSPEDHRAESFSHYDLMFTSLWEREACLQFVRLTLSTSVFAQKNVLESLRHNMISVQNVHRCQRSFWLLAIKMSRKCHPHRTHFAWRFDRVKTEPHEPP